MSETKQNTGTVVQIIGPVLDIRFPPGQMPRLLNAVTVEDDGKTLTAEVEQHVGEDTARCIAMSSTDGLRRGMRATDTGAPISVPVGDATLGRIFNLLGETTNRPSARRSSGRSTAPRRRLTS